MRRYHQIATAHGQPYRDVRIEYPPLTWAAIKVLDGPTVRSAASRLIWSQAALDLLTVGALAFGWGRRAATAYLWLGLVFVVWPFLYLRLDLLSVALAMWGLALLRRRTPRVGGFVLAAACFAKLWPLVLLPLLAIQRSWKAFGAAVGAGLTGFAAWWWWGGTRGISDVLTFRGAKGWQIESITGSLVRVFGSGRVHVESGAWRVGTMTSVAHDALTAALLAAVAVTWWLVRRVGPADPGLADGIAPVTAIAALLIFSPILSPQYVVWLLPFAAIASSFGDRLTSGLAIVVCALSTLLIYEIDAVIAGQSFALGVLALRNSLLVALFAVGLWTIGRVRRGLQLCPEGDIHVQQSGPVDEPELTERAAIFVGASNRGESE
ncbi:MAG TPA: glycosyltransferase 87 family protein [Acidimicrobiia bacterium]|nr:glycosyltransferase 87 family protein [Acidimicrobiia bacterium]